MFKKILLVLTLAVAPAFCQTPCIDAAKTGKVGDCLASTVPVTIGVATMQAGSTAPAGYNSDPNVPQSIKLEFSTPEQAQALVELIKFRYPGSVLSVQDYSNQFDYGYRRLVYQGGINLNQMFSPQVLRITGTVMVNGQSFPTTFSAGWSINVVKLIYGGSYEMQEQGYPFGGTTLLMFFEGGSYQPVWVGGPRQQ